jgi:hypothetical protein
VEHLSGNPHYGRLLALLTNIRLSSKDLSKTSLLGLFIKDKERKLYNTDSANIIKLFSL